MLNFKNNYYDPLCERQPNPSKRKTISELKHYVDPIRVKALCHCEDTLMNVMIDVASICSDGASWPVLRQMLIKAGADIPEDLDQDLDSLQ